MAIILVTYDLKTPGKDYKPVHDYLKQYSYCKKLESVWLLDTTVGTNIIRDDLKKKIDSNDVLFVVQLQRKWGSFNFDCGNWLNEPERNW